MYKNLQTCKHKPSFALKTFMVFSVEWNDKELFRSSAVIRKHVPSRGDLPQTHTMLPAKIAKFWNCVELQAE